MKEVESPRTESSSLQVIHSAEAADLLINPYTLRQLEPFLGRECSVSEAAKVLKEKPNTVLARVKRFLESGLLRVSREQTRKGRAIKLYRSIADSFFVPYEATSAETLESMMAARDDYWASMLRRGVVQTRTGDVGTWGTRIYKDDRGRLQIQTAITPDKNYTMLDDDRPAALSSWRDSVYLDFEDAKNLQQEMFALLKKYHQKEGAQRYIIRLGMAPL